VPAKMRKVASRSYLVNFSLRIREANMALLIRVIAPVVEKMTRSAKGSTPRYIICENPKRNKPSSHVKLQ